MSTAHRVLIVDDEPTIRLAMRTLLMAAGYECVEADDGASALERAAATHPELVLLDLTLPDMKGYAVLARIVEGGMTAVIMSATGHPQEPERALAKGARAYIGKPYRNRVLLDLVRYLLEDLPEAERHALARALLAEGIKGLGPTGS